MLLTTYADGAVDLVNSDLPPSLSVLGALQRRMREVFAAVAAGDPDRAVELLDGLLARTSWRARLRSGPEGPRLDVAGAGQSAAETIAARALVGLAAWTVEFGVDRLGVCAAGDCHNAYLDGTSGRTRRYCSRRCASRANVAAYRARRRAAPRRGRVSA